MTHTLLTLTVNFFRLPRLGLSSQFLGQIFVPEHSRVSHGGGPGHLGVPRAEGLRGIGMELTSSGFGRVAILVAEERTTKTTALIGGAPQRQGQSGERSIVGEGQWRQIRTAVRKIYLRIAICNAVFILQNTMLLLSRNVSDIICF